MVDDVASDARKRHGTLTPLLEAEIKFVVLHPRNARNVFLLWSAIRRREYGGKHLAYSSGLPTKMVCDCFRNGRLLCHAQHSRHACRATYEPCNTGRLVRQ